MKRIFNITLVFAFLSMIAISCKKESLSYEGPSLGHFSADASTFFVEEIEESIYEMPIGLTKPTDQPLTFKIRILEDESTAIEGVHYVLLDDEVTIPAGESVGYIKMTGSFEAVLDRPVLVFELLENGHNASFQQKNKLTLRQFCKYEQDLFVGTYELYSNIYEDVWLVDAVADETDPGIIIFKDVYEEGSDIKVEFNDNVKTKIFAKVRSQNAFVHPRYGQAKASGIGTFDGCDKVIELNLEFIVAAGTFGVIPETFVKVE